MAREFRRYLVMSEVHANKFALEAVLNDAKAPIDGRYCIGNIVGYGPHPNEVIELLRKNSIVCVAGPHDKTVINGREDYQDPSVRKALEITDLMLTDRSRDYLNSLPTGPVIDRANHIAIVHGNFVHGAHFNVICYNHEKAAALDALTDGYDGIFVGVVGRTHAAFISAVRCMRRGGQVFKDEIETQYGINGNRRRHRVQRHNPHSRKMRVLISPGSVGHPEDSQKAKYSIVTIGKKTITVQFRSVHYDTSRTQRDMRLEGFPTELIDRLGR